MKKTQIAFALALVLAANVSFAEGYGNSGTTGQNQATNATGTGTGQAQSSAGGGAVTFAPVSGDVINRYSASSAFAPALTTSNDTCMGSSGIGASGASFSLSLGSTWEDKNCKMLKNARELWNQGQRSAAMALMCDNDDNRYAIMVSGGVVVADGKGNYVRVGCPMTKDEWVAKGRPLLDPVTGQAIDPGMVVVSAPASTQQPLMAKQGPALVGPPVPQAVVDAKADQIVQHAQLIAAQSKTK